LAPLHCLCFGSFGDSLANLLWRVENGEAERFTPKCIVVSIGQSETPREVNVDEYLAALVQLAQLLREKQPSAKIFFMVCLSLLSYLKTLISHHTLFST